MLEAIIGGLIIGLAVSLMLLFNGRVTGIAGIIGNSFTSKGPDFHWRIAFIGGLMAGGLLLLAVQPEAFVNLSQAKTIDYVIAGLLVGFGTLLGNGCTSGHGVCGISRFSVRSIMSTVTFIFFGVLSVLLFKAVRGDL